MLGVAITWWWSRRCVVHSNPTAAAVVYGVVCSTICLTFMAGLYLIWICFGAKALFQTSVTSASVVRGVRGLLGSKELKMLDVICRRGCWYMNFCPCWRSIQTPSLKKIGSCLSLINWFVQVE